METEPHAVRWITNNVEKMYLRKYTKWHYTTDAAFTACGRLIRLTSGSGGRLPEHDEVSRVDCKQCRKRAEQERKARAKAGHI